MSNSSRNILAASALFALFAALFSCGRIIDPDSVVVAELDGRSIRQGDLYKWVRRLGEVDRPLIQTRGDAVRALYAMIDSRILTPYAEELKSSGRIQIPREIARAAYFAKYPDFQQVYDIPDSQISGLDAIRAQVDFGIDDEEARLYREAALSFMAQEAYAAGNLAVSEQEIAAEFETRENRLMQHEQIDFIGIRFPTSDPSARAGAASARERIDAGETFDSLVAEYRAKDPALILESGLENDPANPKFQAFWEVVSESEPGSIHLAFLPEFNVVTESDTRRTQTVAMPASQMLVKVLARTPAKPLTLEESRDRLIPVVIRRKMMEQLREKHAVAVYPEALHDPAGFGDQFKGSTIRTTAE